MRKKLLALSVLMLAFSCAQNQQPKAYPSTQAKTTKVVKKKTPSELDTLKTQLSQILKEIEALKASNLRTQAQISSLSDRVASLENRMSAAEQEIYSLEQTCNQTQETLSALTAPKPTPSNNQTQVNTNATASYSGNATASENENATSETPSNATQEVVNLSDKDIYKKAFDAMENGDFETAKRLFELLYKRYPDSPLADNALYWMGEIYYSHNDYATALTYFKKVIEKYGKYYPSPKGNKAPAALLKTAYCYIGMGNDAKAKEILKEVIQKYPGTPEAARAKAKLLELGG